MKSPDVDAQTEDFKEKEPRQWLIISIKSVPCIQLNKQWQRVPAINKLPSSDYSSR